LRGVGTEMRSPENLRINKSTGDAPHLKKFRADALMGPRVSIATDCNMKSGGREEYLVSFLPWNKYYYYYFLYPR